MLFPRVDMYISSKQNYLKDSIRGANSSWFERTFEFICWLLIYVHIPSICIHFFFVPMVPCIQHHSGHNMEIHQSVNNTMHVILVHKHMQVWKLFLSNVTYGNPN